MPPGVPDNFYKKIIEKIHTKTSKTFTALDADGSALKKGITANPDLIKPNIWELERLVSRKVQSIRQIRDIVEKFLNSGISFVLITLGEKGSLGFSNQGFFFAKGPKIRNPGSVGCGDVFLGGFILNFSRTGNFVESLRYAAAAGTAKACKPATDIPKPEEVEKILKKTSIWSVDALSERTKRQLLQGMPEKK